jgi:hypothetical protein
LPIYFINKIFSDKNNHAVVFLIRLAAAQKWAAVGAEKVWREP